MDKKPMPDVSQERIVKAVVRITYSKRKQFKVATAQQGVTMQVALEKFIDDYIGSNK